MVDRRLGRGLDFFLSGGRGITPKAKAKAKADRAAAKGAAGDLESSGEEILTLETSRLYPNPNQPRGAIDSKELRDLAASIRINGILQPILARRVGDEFEIVAGERRWRAAKLAEVDRIPVLVRDISDNDSAVFALVENVQREDLNALEKARAFRQLQEKLGTTQEQVAKRVGLDRSSVANFVRLLDLPADVQAHVSRGTLSMGHARALLSLVEPTLMVAMADTAIRGAWSVRKLEQRVREANEAAARPVQGGKKKPTKGRPVWLNEIEEALVENLGTPVTVRYGSKRSQIVIDCGNREEFERLYERLKNA